MNAGGVDKACKSNASSWTLATRYWKMKFMRDFSQLDVYKRSSELFPKIYKIVRSWSKDDQKELGSQLIRSANSIHANIAEGFSKSSRDFARYISTAIGSCDETRSHIGDALRVGLIKPETEKTLLSEYVIVGKQLTKLKQSVLSRN